MKLKKLCAMLVSGVFAAGMLGVFPSVKSDRGKIYSGKLYCRCKKPCLWILCIRLLEL